MSYNGQPIAVVIGKSIAEAREGGNLLKVKYSQMPAKIGLKNRQDEARWPKNPGKEPAGNKRGDVAAGFAQASVTVDQTYTTPIQNHNPMEPHGTIAWWTGEKLEFVRLDAGDQRRQTVDCETVFRFRWMMCMWSARIRAAASGRRARCGRTCRWRRCLPR